MPAGLTVAVIGGLVLPLMLPSCSIDPLVADTLSQAPPETTEGVTVKVTGRGVPFMIRKLLGAGVPPPWTAWKVNPTCVNASPRLLMGRSTGRLSAPFTLMTSGYEPDGRS